MAADGASASRKPIVPPAPDWPRGESAILEELTEQEIGIELWQDLRHVRDWLETPAQDRAALFHPTPAPRVLLRRTDAAEEAPELVAALEVFVELTAQPVRIEPRRLAAACEIVADWAGEGGHLGTAAEFASASAALDASDPMLANLAGLMRRRVGDAARAEMYYARAIGLAREQRNAIEYISGHIGTAALLYGLGEYHRARKHLLRAASAAHRSGRLWLAGHAYHDLMLILTEKGQLAEAEATARRAAELYPLHDRRFPIFVADFALLLVTQERYADALPLLRRFMEVVEGNAAARAVVTSLWARCAGGLGRGDEYRRLERDAVELVGRHAEFAPAVFVHLAEGARSVGAWDRALVHAQSAQRFAHARRDREVTRLAARLLTQIADRRFPSASPTPSSDGALSRILAARLAKWNPRNQRGRKRVRLRNQWVA